MKCPRCKSDMVKIKEVVSKGIIKIRRITYQCPKCGYIVVVTKHKK